MVVLVRLAGSVAFLTCLRSGLDAAVVPVPASVRLVLNSLECFIIYLNVAVAEAGGLHGRCEELNINCEWTSCRSLF